MKSRAWTGGDGESFASLANISASMVLNAIWRFLRISEREASRIIDEVTASISGWKCFAEEAGLPNAPTSEIGAALLHAIPVS